MKKSGFLFLTLLLSIFLSAELWAQFMATELLGKPTNNSITVNVIPSSNMLIYYEYGTVSGGPYTATSTESATGGVPYEIVIDGLNANTRYYYRMQYSTDGGSTWTARPEYSFMTQRPAGSTFVFTIVSDSHAMYNTQYQQAMQNVSNDHPDFHFDLGDTFMTDGMSSQSAVDNAYLAQREPLYMDLVGSSAPIFLASGNHENEEGWNLDDSFSLAVASVIARKKYFPTPVTDAFYSGNEDPLADIDAGTYGDQYREDYYAWTWGDALFVVFDPFQYTMANPYGATAGEGSDDPASGDRWNWSLGQEQYNWLKQTLENSNAKYKFMFAHHMLGGTQNYVRGGAVPAHMFEWGGNNADGTTWGWDTQRPGWDDDPIRQLMIDNHVSAFFHGHDHQYAYEVRDDIVYLCLPRPSTGMDFNYYSESNEYTERVLASGGHIRVTVTPSVATVEYVTSNNSSGAVQHSFTIAPNAPGITHDLTMAADPTEGGTTDPAVGIHTYDENDIVSITATAVTGYEFSYWDGNVADINSASTTVTMDGDKTVTAHFTAVTTYDLTMAVDPSEGGTTNPGVGVHTYNEDTEVTITATPVTGYEFDHWEGEVADVNSATTTVTMDASKTVTAYFTAIPTYDLTMAVDPSGSGITDPVVGIHTYSENTIVTITATADPGYVFDHWDGDVANSSTTTTTVTMDGDKTVTAVFIVYESSSAILDGAVSSATADGVSTVSVTHTTGTGEDRLLLVGITSNSYNGAQSITSVTFTPSGGSATALTEVGSVENESGRLAAIYGLLDPPNGVTGTVTVTYSGTVNYGIVVGVANFADVNQSDPFDDFASAVGNSTGTTDINVDVATDVDDLVFDVGFLGGSPLPTATAGAGQTELWNTSVDRAGGIGSIEPAGTSTTSMSWTLTAASGTYYWALGAVPINPSETGPRITLSGTPLSNFTSEPGTPSAEKSYVVSGSDLTDNISITAPADFEISTTSGSGWTSSLTLTQSGGVVSPTTIYVRFNRATVGTSSGNITHTSSGAFQKNVAVSGTASIPGDINFIGNIGSVYDNAEGTSLQMPVTADVAEGNTIIVGFASRGATTYNEPVVTDAAGNTYHLASVAVTYSHGRSYIYYAFVENALSTGQNITITTSSVASRVAVASVFSGLASVNAVDQALGYPALGDNETAQGNNPSVGPTGATTQADELVIGMIGTEEADDAGTGTWLNGFSTGPQQKTSGASYEWRVSMGYLIASTTNQFTAAKTVTNNPYWAAAIATFKSENSLSPDNYNIVLGRPTNNSITVNTIMEISGDVYFEYGTTSGDYSAGQTGVLSATAGTPVETVIGGLSSSAQYFYRLVFRASGTSVWIPGEEYTFHTQRAPGESFTFTILSDSHLGQTFSSNTPERYEQTTMNVAADHPDFHLDLGDAFIVSSDLGVGSNVTGTQGQVDAVYEQQRPYFGNFSHSVPVFLAIGNHENEEGWNLDDTPFSRALASIIARKEYFPNPYPDGFYTGNNDLLPAIGGDELREDYYSWTWGDALFIVLDPFQYTMTKTYGTITGSGEDDDEVVDADQWNWTLGEEQYNWFVQTLQNSTATYKFVFAHHMVGGQLEVSGAAGAPGYVRGGGMGAPYFEWGGNNADNTWGFDSERPSFENNPIHNLMLTYGVSAFFHGHDHQFVHEEIDGIVYQLVPSAGMQGYGFDLYDDSPYVVSGGNLPSSGHLRVTVNPSETTVEYVRSEEGGGGINGDVDHSYIILPSEPQEPSITVNSPNGGENLFIGSTKSISWTSIAISGNIHIEYSVNNGSTWSDVSASAPNIGSFDWTVPDVTSTTCLIRVSNSDGSYSDVSDAVFSIAEYVPPSGLIAYYPFNGNANDESGHGNNGTVYGATLVPDRFGNENHAYYFDGIDNYIGTDQSLMNDLETFSITGWINPSSSGDHMGFWGQNDLFEFGFIVENYINIWIEEGSINLTQSYPYPYGEWHFLSTVGDGDSLKLYMDGDLVGFALLSVSNYGNSYFMFNIGGGGIFRETGDYFEGSIDDIRVYANALNISDIRVLYNEGNPLEHEITVTSPNGGEDWNVGTSHDITWTSNLTSGSVEIEYSTDGSTWDDIIASTDDDGLYSWIVPDEPSANCRVRITDTDGSPSDESDAVFTISPVSAITVTSPNGGEEWQAGSTYDITWSSVNTSGFVHIEYSTDGSTWADVVASTDDDGSYSWTIPNEPSANCLVRISDTDGSPIDESDAVFTILSAPFITLTSPNGGEQWQMGTSKDITWNSYGTSGTVHIELSTDNGSSWNDVIASTEDDGTFEWTVPNEPSVECLVRISDTDSDPTDQSDDVFTISTQHFVPVWTGNGVDHMNFYAMTAQVEGVDMQPGDEIGIYDGDYCVGASILTEVLITTNPLEIRVSRDDETSPEVDGYTTGNTATFKLWDASEEQEITNVEVTFVINPIYGTDIFQPGLSSWFDINGLGTITQSIDLNDGWNIFSLYVTPSDIAMMSILQTLIDEESLLKVQDETGAAIEPAPGDTWINNIHDWENTEGYKIRVNMNTSLEVEGMPIALPLTIPLVGGWNIISYPVAVPQDAMAALDELITDDNLLKVQDETGAAIEPAPGDTWINNIHNFQPNEGYKVRITVDDDLTLDAPDKSLANMENTAGIERALHFNTCWNGNGIDHMNIYFAMANSDFQAGDEIGIFDGDLCVGAGRISDPSVKFLALVASADDPTTPERDGFIAGHILQFKVWSASDKQVNNLNKYEYLDGSVNRFEPMGSAFVQVKSAPNSLFSPKAPLTRLSDNYPNPFSESTIIPFAIGEKTTVDLAIYDILGQRVNTLIHVTLTPGSYTTEWNGTNDKGIKVAEGIYFIKMIADNQVFVKTIEKYGN